MRVKPQCGAVAYYTAGVFGKGPSLSSLQTLNLKTIGIKRGRMGIHDWDNTIAQVGSKNLMIVSKQLLDISHF